MGLVNQLLRAPLHPPPAGARVPSARFLKGTSVVYIKSCLDARQQIQLRGRFLARPELSDNRPAAGISRRGRTSARKSSSLSAVADTAAAVLAGTVLDRLRQSVAAASSRSERSIPGRPGAGV